MRESVVALVGAGAGPDIPLFNRKAVLKVSGMNGGELTARTKCRDRQPLGKRVISVDGDYELPGPAYYVSVECRDADERLIAKLLRG